MYSSHQFTRNGAECFISKHLHGAFVGLQRIVEGQFILIESKLTTSTSTPHLNSKAAKAFMCFPIISYSYASPIACPRLQHSKSVASREAELLRTL
jgi:hypothetical protein